MTEATRNDIQDGFVFRGGMLALDLVNTEIAVRGKPHDLLETPADLARWLAIIGERYQHTGLEHSQETISSQLLATTKALRAALRRACTAIAHKTQTEAADLEVINNVLSRGHITLITAPSGEVRQIYTLESGGSTVLFEVALSAVHLLTKCDQARLHLCRNKRCVLLFYDTTKSGTRQWCSLDCFNRTRSSENYRRRKVAAQEQP